MNVSRRQAIFGSIATAFAGPGLVASVEAAELRAKMEPLLKWLNEHQHHVTGIFGPTSPHQTYIAGKAQFVGTMKMRLPEDEFKFKVEF